MKVFKKSYPGLFLIALCFCACKKDKAKLPVASVSSIISASELDKLKQYGTIINKGYNPPVINGTYQMHLNVCSYDNSAEKLNGQIFDDYTYTFFNQQPPVDSIINLRFSSTDASANDAGTDAGNTFIYGNNNLFTVISVNQGVEDGVKYVSADIISGEAIISSSTGAVTGIKNLQVTEVLTSKSGDDTTNPLLTEAGTTRIFYDSDYLSEKVSNAVLTTGTVRNSAQLKAGAHAMHMARRIH